jgi:hypothetical protein
VLFVSLLPLIVLTSAFSPEFRGASRIFLDTADSTSKEWDELLPTTGIFHVVTTTLTRLKRAGEKCTVANLHQMAHKALSRDKTRLIRNKTLLSLT